MSINKTVQLTWDGKLYKTKIDMELIDKIEDKVDLLQLVNMMNPRKPERIKYSLIARLMQTLLEAAGAECTDEEVFDALFGSGKVTENEVSNFISSVLNVIFPTPKKKPAGGSKKTSKSSKGKASTKKT